MSGFNIQEILRYLPHKHPFLMVDRVDSVVEGVEITGLKNVTANEPYFTGHFPGRPIMPGVMIIESLAQLCGILAMQSYDKDDNNVFYLVGVDNAKFKKMVIPGDAMVLHATISKQKRSLWKFQATASVAGELACSADIMIAKE